MNYKVYAVGFTHTSNSFPSKQLGGEEGDNLYHNMASETVSLDLRSSCHCIYHMWFVDHKSH